MRPVSGSSLNYGSIPDQSTANMSFDNTATFSSSNADGDTDDNNDTPVEESRQSSVPQGDGLFLHDGQDDTEHLPSRHRQSPLQTAMDPSRMWEVIQERRRTHDVGTAERLGHGPAPGRQQKKWVSLAFGQCIAVLAASMNASSFTLTDHYGVDTQFFQMFLMYMLLSINLRWREPPGHFMLRTEDDENGEHHAPVTAQTTQQQQYKIPFTSIHLKIPWWIYLIMSILDVLPNFMALFSFRYTSLTSTTLLGSLTAPTTMLFSKYILARSFGFYNYVGVALCLLGGTLTIWSDVDSSSGPTHSYIGDLLAVTAAILYGFGDTVAEYFSKHVDRHEYIGMLGVFGSMITGLTFPFLESSALVGIANMDPRKKAEVCAVMVFYVLSVLFYYIAEAKFLVSSDATLLNLSMQASNLWAIIFSVIVYHILPPPAFYVALVFVVIGVFVYELGGVVTQDTQVGANSATRTSEEEKEREEESRDQRSRNGINGHEIT